MNYAGHENSAQKWRKSPTACDLRATLNGMEHRYRFDSDVLAERLARQTLFASMPCLWRHTTKCLSWMPALRTKEKNMYGTCENLCRLLREQYPAETL